MIPSNKKQRQLIGIACGQLGIDKETKADMLIARFGKSSTCDISEAQANDFLKELRLKGFKSKPRRFPGRPNFGALDISQVALMKKIEAYLAEAKRPWKYGHGLAKKIVKRDRLEWCKAHELHKIVAAMEYDARRHGRSTG